jgi:predicted GIY-YIG superfamily endonuclease
MPSPQARTQPKLTGKKCTNFQQGLFQDGVFNLFDLAQPHIYQIKCKVNGKKYFGEASNLLERIANHFSSLNANFHDCQELQNNWNLYQLEQFEAIMLFSKPDWQNKQTRLQMEKELIASLSLSEVYNNHSESAKPRKTMGLPVQLTKSNMQAFATLRK